MLLTDELLKIIFAAREAAGIKWQDNIVTDNALLLGKDRGILAEEFCRAMENGELTIHYQPQINLANAEISGLEALARWEHPRYGIIYPDDFIPIVELSGLSARFDEWVLNKVCRQMQFWQQNKMFVVVSLNISGEYFKIPGFVANMCALLAKYNINPGCLGIEIAESAAILDIGRIWGVMSELLKLGVTVSIDDVGTNYASVSQLCNAPINVIKIDESFINKLPHHENTAIFVRNIFDIAISSKILTLAEGVESKAQIDFLRKYACNLAQGYLICPPLPVEMIESFLKFYTLKLNSAGINQTKCPSFMKTNSTQAVNEESREESLKASLNHEKLINTVHAIILSGEDVSDSIDKALRLLGQYFDACGAYIAETDAGLKKCSIIYEWACPGQTLTASKIAQSICGREDYYSLFRAGIFYANDAATLPEPLAECYAKVGCRSFFQAITIIGGTIAGHIGFIKNTSKVWNNQEINILKSIANIFSAALTRVRAEREISWHYKQMQMVMEHIDALIVVIDAETCEVLFANKKFKEKFMLPEDKSFSQAGSHARGIYPLREKLAPGQVLTVEKYDETLAAWLAITNTGIIWLDNKPAILQSATDISVQKKHEQLIAGMAYEDTLTSLPNRRAMEEYLEKKFLKFQKDYQPVYIAMLDIDNFKVINDGYGHDAGDAILKATANLLKIAVGAQDKACRWGGEEFVVCFGCSSSAEAKQAAERLREKIAANRVIYGGNEHFITVSIGIAEFKSTDKHYSETLYEADKAMYKSKALGKNQVTYIGLGTVQ